MKAPSLPLAAALSILLIPAMGSARQALEQETLATPSVGQWDATSVDDASRVERSADTATSELRTAEADRVALEATPGVRRGSRSPGVVSAELPGSEQAGTLEGPTVAVQPGESPARRWHVHLTVHSKKGYVSFTAGAARGTWMPSPDGM